MAEAKYVRGTVVFQKKGEHDKGVVREVTEGGGEIGYIYKVELDDGQFVFLTEDQITDSKPESRSAPARRKSADKDDAPATAEVDEDPGIARASNETVS